jgi:hypothetical protein
MDRERRYKTPSQVAFAFAVFFTLYGFYAMFLSETPHPLYAGFSWLLALLWLGLSWVSRKGTRP